MTDPQIVVFTNATGGVASPAQLLLVIASVMAVINLLWLAWIVYSQYRSWQNGQGDFYDLIFASSRAAVIALLIGFFIR